MCRMVTQPQRHKDTKEHKDQVLPTKERALTLPQNPTHGRDRVKSHRAR